jgi:hypothetical protein
MPPHPPPSASLPEVHRIRGPDTLALLLLRPALVLEGGPKRIRCHTTTSMIEKRYGHLARVKMRSEMVEFPAGTIERNWWTGWRKSTRDRRLLPDLLPNQKQKEPRKL